MRKVLITGAAGNLGIYLLRHAPDDVEVHAVWRQSPCRHVPNHQLDLGNTDAVERLFAEVKPQLVIHTAYSTEDMERNIIGATRNIAEACRARGCELLHMSTDMIFDGEHAPYAEDAEARPVFPYGEAKLRAEQIVRERLPSACIARSSLILGLNPLNSSSGWLIEALRRQESATLFVDELRTPIGADDLALYLWELAGLPADRRAGIWHLAAPESLSRMALGLLLARYFQLDLSLLRAALNRDLTQPRPRDLRISTARADRELQHRPTPVSELLAPPH